MKNKDLTGNKLKIAQLLEQIRYLIATSEEEKKKWTNRSSFLFKQKDRLNNLLDFSENERLIKAYLVLQGFKYMEKGEIGVGFVINKINKEIEILDKDIEKEEEREFIDLIIEKIKRGWLSWESLYKKYFKDLSPQEWERIVKEMDQYREKRLELEVKYNSDGK